MSHHRRKRKCEHRRKRRHRCRSKDRRKESRDSFKCKSKLRHRRRSKDRSKESRDCFKCKSRSKDHGDRCKRREKIKFCIVLTGTQEATRESPPVFTTGLGAGTACLSKDRSRVKFKLYVENLESPIKEPSRGLGFAHFHLGRAGIAGPIVKNISKDFKLSKDRKSGVACGVWTKWDKNMPLTKELVKALKEGKLYINVHTEQHPGGEVRGQVVRKDKKKKHQKKKH